MFWETDTCQLSEIRIYMISPLSPVIGVIKSTGWTFENYLNNKSLCRHPCWCNRWPDTDRKLLIVWLWYCTTACSYIAAGALLFKILLLIPISYEVGISMWLQRTFTEKRNHEIRWRACLLTCLNMLDFTGKTIIQKYIFPSATLS